jgi:hypothetical protein
MNKYNTLFRQLLFPELHKKLFVCLLFQQTVSGCAHRVRAVPDREREFLYRNNSFSRFFSLSSIYKPFKIFCKPFMSLPCFRRNNLQRNSIKLFGAAGMV